MAVSAKLDANNKVVRANVDPDGFSDFIIYELANGETHLQKPDGTATDAFDESRSVPSIGFVLAPDYEVHFQDSEGKIVAVQEGGHAGNVTTTSFDAGTGAQVDDPDVEFKFILADDAQRIALRSNERADGNTPPDFSYAKGYSFAGGPVSFQALHDVDGGGFQRETTNWDYSADGTLTRFYHSTVDFDVIGVQTGSRSETYTFLNPTDPGRLVSPSDRGSMIEKNVVYQNGLQQIDYYYPDGSLQLHQELSYANGRATLLAYDSFTPGHLLHLNLSYNPATNVSVVTSGVPERSITFGGVTLTTGGEKSAQFTANINALIDNPLRVITHDGGSVISNDGGSLISQDGGGLISNDGGGVITHDGGSVITHDGGSVISNDGGSVITHDGGSLLPGILAAAVVSRDGAGLLAKLISQDGGGVITHDGGSLISHDGGSVITHDGGSLISHDGGSVITHDGGSLLANAAQAYANSVGGAGVLMASLEGAQGLVGLEQHNSLLASRIITDNGTGLTSPRLYSVVSTPDGTGSGDAPIPGLVALYEFENPVFLGIDSSGRGGGSLYSHGGTSYQLDGKFGLAAHFDGTGSLTTYDETVLPGFPIATDSYSLSAWVRAEADTTSVPFPTQVASQVPLQNAGFETPDFGGGYSPPPSLLAGWTFTHGGIAASYSAYANGAAAPEGHQVAYLQASTTYSESSTISQSFTSEAGDHQVNFSAAERAGYTNLDFNVLLDDHVVGTYGGVAHPLAADGYSTFTTDTVSLAAGAHTLTFQSLNTAQVFDSTALIDNVSVETTGSGATSIGGSSSAGQNAFTEDFDSEATGLDHRTFQNWTVDGSVDVLGEDFFNLKPGNGRYVDMNGNTGSPGALTTKETFGPGTYHLEFTVGGTFRGYADAVRVGLGSYQEEFTLADQEVRHIARDVLITGNEHLRIEDLGRSGNANVGALLFDVTLSRVDDSSSSNHEIIGFGRASARNALDVSATTVSNVGGTASLTTNANLFDGFYHNVTATYDGTVRKLFVDGQLAGSDSPAQPNVGVDDFVIGRNFKGDLDNVAVFNRALTDVEVAQVTAGVFVEPNARTAPDRFLYLRTLDSNSALGSRAPDTAFGFVSDAAFVVATNDGDVGRSLSLRKLTLGGDAVAVNSPGSSVVSAIRPQGFVGATNGDFRIVGPKNDASGNVVFNTFNPQLEQFDSLDHPVLNTSTAQNSFGDVFALTGGGFGVAVQDDSNAAQGANVRGRFYDQDNDPITATDVLLSAGIAGDQTHPAGVQLASGNIAVAFGAPGRGYGLSLVDPSGNVLRTDTDTMLDAATDGAARPSIETLPASDEIVVAYVANVTVAGGTHHAIRLQLFDTEGHALGSPIRVPGVFDYANHPVVRATADGGFVVGAVAATANGSAQGGNVHVELLKYDASGTLVASSELASPFNSGHPVLTDIRQAPDGEYLVSVAGENQDGPTVIASHEIWSVVLATRDDTVLRADLANPNGQELVVEGQLSPRGQDWVVGGEGNDALIGSDRVSHIFGGAGDDLLRGNGGDDQLWGGFGIDTARMSGALADYDISRSTGQDGVEHVTVHHVRPTGTVDDGTDTLIGVEKINFRDQTIDIAPAVPVDPGPAPDPNRDSFGTVVHDAASPGARVYELYDGLLGRAPDTLGSSFWGEALEDGVPLSAVAQAFLDSDEGASRFGNTRQLDDNAFVDQLYRLVLDRAPDDGGKASWLSDLAEGAPRGDVARGFALSEEHLAALSSVLEAGVFAPNQDAADAARLYYGVLGRAPDQGGLASFTADLENNVTLGSVAGSMLSSPEFVSHFGDLADQDFLEHLYEGALGRGPAGDPGAQYWSSLLQGGAARSSVAADISESPEAQLHLAAVIENGHHLA